MSCNEKNGEKQIQAGKAYGTHAQTSIARKFNKLKKSVGNLLRLFKSSPFRQS